MNAGSTSGSGGGIDPALAHLIEEAVLFGRTEDIAALIHRVMDDDTLPDAIRHDLESLFYFRSHYSQEDLTEDARRRMVAIDADWTMHIIQKIHPQHFGKMAVRGKP